MYRVVQRFRPHSPRWAAWRARRSRWTWRTYEVPEGGSASYCSADPLSRNNCVQGYGSPL